MPIRGIERVDAFELDKQRALTDALWAKLQEQGMEDGVPGHIECYFVAPTDAEVARLTPGFPEWECAITESDGSSKLVRFVSPLVHVTREAFMGLLEVSLVAAADSGCTFDGFQVDSKALIKKKRWWQI
jgi:hypothetical protein